MFNKINRSIFVVLASNAAATQILQFVLLLAMLFPTLKTFITMALDTYDEVYHCVRTFPIIL